MENKIDREDADSHELNKPINRNINLIKRVDIIVRVVYLGAEKENREKKCMEIQEAL